MSSKSFKIPSFGEIQGKALDELRVYTRLLQREYKAVVDENTLHVNSIAVHVSRNNDLRQELETIGTQCFKSSARKVEAENAELKVALDRAISRAEAAERQNKQLRQAIDSGVAKMQENVRRIFDLDNQSPTSSLPISGGEGKPPVGFHIKDDEKNPDDVICYPDPDIGHPNAESDRELGRKQQRKAKLLPPLAAKSNQSPTFPDPDIQPMEIEEAPQARLPAMPIVSVPSTSPRAPLSTTSASLPPGVLYPDAPHVRRPKNRFEQLPVPDPASSTVTPTMPSVAAPPTPYGASGIRYQQVHRKRRRDSSGSRSRSRTSPKLRRGDGAPGA
ncbi:MAG: hypothetical protein Q9224_004339 [Gallowayella concinna]